MSKWKSEEKNAAKRDTTGTLYWTKFVEWMIRVWWCILDNHEILLNCHVLTISVAAMG